MAIHHLIRTDGAFIPGGYPFTDPRTGMKFDGMDAVFNDQVKRIIQHRAANPAKYPPGEVGFLDFDSVASELSIAQCQRLKGHPKYCTDGTRHKQMPVMPVATERKCQCGAKLEPTYCPTCGGNKVTGYKCPICKTKFPK